MWDLPGPGLEPVSPALAGGFLTTAPPGKPRIDSFAKDVRKRAKLMGSKTDAISPKEDCIIWNNIKYM